LEFDDFISVLPAESRRWHHLILSAPAANPELGESTGPVAPEISYPPRCHWRLLMEGVVTFLLTSKPDEAVAFFRDTLGFNFLRDDGFALVFDMNGVLLRIGKMKSFTPAQHTVLGWETSRIESAVDELVQKGVVFERYPNMGQDQRGIATFPGGDKVVWFKDPDGNVLSLSHHVATKNPAS
jgi:catechol 2,3-dioxygenase-like lactoylglutathione lyase family enzyme